MNRRTFAAATVAALALPRFALSQGKFAYTELKQQQPRETSSNKIETLEFFWYG